MLICRNLATVSSQSVPQLYWRLMDNTIHGNLKYSAQLDRILVWLSRLPPLAGLVYLRDRESGSVA